MSDQIVVLDYWEILMGQTVGCHRRMESINRGETNKVQNKDFGWHTDIESTLAEIAVAKYLNIYWGGHVNSFKAPDVGPYQVRHTQHKKGRLIIRDNDPPEEIYVLVTGTHPKYTIRGYMRGIDGMKPEYRDNPIKKPNAEAWCVPQSVLRPIEELKQKIHGNKYPVDRLGY